MNVDERVQQAGERLAARPVWVPPFERLERAARKRRQAVVSVVSLVALGATTVGVWATAGSDAGSISSSESTETATTVPASPATTTAPDTTTVAATSLPVNPVPSTPTTITEPDGIEAGSFADIEPDSTVILPPAPIAGRVSPAAVWTGTEMVVWGGSVLLSPLGAAPLSDGAAFNPTTGTWRVIAAAPIQGRADPATVWTGTEMVVWGGSTGAQTVADGAAYDPATDTWRTLPAAPIPDATGPVVAWTGTEMLVVSGMRTSSGGLTPVDDAAAYDPATDTWRQIASPPGMITAPDPQFAWTGASLLMVTSEFSQTNPVAEVFRLVEYQPANDTWTIVVDDFAYTLVEVSSIGAAVALPYEEGADAVVLDRRGAVITRVDGRPATLAPLGFGQPTWTGHEILFWGGNTDGVALNPATQTWRTFPAGDVANRVDAAVVWADGVMLGWGGFSFNRDGTNVAADDGVMYRPPTPGAVPTTSPSTDATISSSLAEFDEVLVDDPLGPGSWSGARTSADGTSLVLLFVGAADYRAGDSCTMRYVATVEESDTDVRVAIRGERPPGPAVCRLLGHWRSVTVDLSQPFGDRELIVLGESRDVFDGSTLAQPQWIPDGWQEGPEQPAGFGAGPSASWLRTWAPPHREPQDGACTPGPSGFILFQGAASIVNAFPSQPGETMIDTFDVNGATATYSTDDRDVARLSWILNNHGFVLQSSPTCAGDDPPTIETMLRFARNLDT